jgi:hypothetical protein
MEKGEIKARYWFLLLSCSLNRPLRGAAHFGVRRQSEAATALWRRRESMNKYLPSVRL